MAITKNKYDELINNYDFMDLMRKHMNIDVHNSSEFSKIPTPFLDKCLQYNNFFKRLVANSYKLNNSLFEKIVYDNLQMDDISSKELCFLPYCKRTPQINRVLRRDMNIPDNTYSAIKLNEDFTPTISKRPKEIDSFFKDVKVYSHDEEFIDSASLYDEGIIVLNPVSKDVLNEGYINDESVLILSYNDYRRLSQNHIFFEILNTHQFILSDNVDEYKYLSKINCKYVRRRSLNDDYDYNEDDMIKYNHAIMVVNESSLSQPLKDYYLYKLTNYNNPFDIEKTITDIETMISEEEIKRSTDRYNQLSYEEKIKQYEKTEYSINFFNIEYPDFFENTIEEQIDILLSLKSSEFYIVIEDNRVQQLFDTKIEDKNSLRGLKKLLERVGTVQNNEVVYNFVERLGIDIKEALDSEEFRLESENSINLLLYNYEITDGKEQIENIPLDDIVGMSSGFFQDDSDNLIDNYHRCFKTNGSSYETRANGLLNYDSLDKALSALSGSFTSEPFSLSEYDNKYIIEANGCHRYLLLRLLYLKELRDSGLTREELREKYVLPVCVVRRINPELSYLNFLLHELLNVRDVDRNIVKDENGNIIQDSEQKLEVSFTRTEKKVMTVNEIKELIREKLNNIQGYQLMLLNSYYKNYESFKLFMDNNYPELVSLLKNDEEMGNGKSM